jgi:hypothetical protein
MLKLPSYKEIKATSFYKEIKAMSPHKEIEVTANKRVKIIDGKKNKILCIFSIFRLDMTLKIFLM